jgi:hypothetical protein
LTSGQTQPLIFHTLCRGGVLLSGVRTSENQITPGAHLYTPVHHQWTNRVLCAAGLRAGPDQRTTPTRGARHRPPHPRRCPGSRHPRTPHERTPHAGTVQERTPSHVRKACPGNQVFCIWQPCARDAGNKNAASAYGMGSGGLAVDAMSIGCRGVKRRVERFLHLDPFHTGIFNGSRDR